jgi:polysaccharide chain length determinant protein (PEP-CTERM system associated)
MNNLNYRIYNILAGAWRRRYVIVIPALLLPIVGLVVGITTPNNYLSHTSMLIQETAKMNPFLEDLAVSSMLKDRMSALKALLNSRHILRVVAEERGLIDEGSSLKKQDNIISQLSRALSVQMIGKDMIRIDYKTHSPENMKETLESVRKQFIEQLLAPERSSMTDSSFFLNEHLEIRQLELEKSEAALADFKDQHSTELPELHLTNINRLAQLKQLLSEREAAMAGASRSLGGLDQQLSKTNPVLGRIEEQIVHIRGELALLRVRYTEKHSKVVAAMRDLRRLEDERQNILKHTDNTVDINKLWAIASNAQINANSGEQPLLVSQLENLQSTRSKVDGLDEEIKSFKKMVEQLESQMSGYGANANKLSKLERDLGVKRGLYDDLLLRRENARITSSLGVFERDKRVKVIDRPFTPTSPNNLSVVIFIISGLFGGIFLGIGIAVLLEVGDSTLRRRDQLEALAGVPVLSRVPDLSPITSIN